MTQENINLDNTTSAQTIEHYLREGRKLRSQQAWAATAAIGDAFRQKRTLQTTAIFCTAAIMAYTLPLF